MRLKEFRKLNNLTMKQVAFYLGISMSFYADIETGRHRIIEPRIKKLCELYKCSREELLGLEPIISNNNELEAITHNYIKLLSDILKED